MTDVPVEGRPAPEDAEDPAEPAPIRAVLDTNVPIAAHLSRNPRSPTIELIDRWRAAEFVQLYSDDTLAELQEKFIARQIAPDIAAQYVADLLRLGEYVEVTAEDVKPIIAADPDDDLVLACAVVGGATHIVTYDPHFDALGRAYQGIPILDGGLGGFEFGDLLGELSLAQVVLSFGQGCAVGQVGARSFGAALGADQVGKIAPGIELVERFQDVQPALAVRRGSPSSGQACLGDLLLALEGGDSTLQGSDTVGGLGHLLLMGRSRITEGSIQTCLGIGQPGLGLCELPLDELHVSVKLCRIAGQPGQHLAGLDLVAGVDQDLGQVVGDTDVDSLNAECGMRNAEYRALNFELSILRSEFRSGLRENGGCSWLDWWCFACLPRHRQAGGAGDQ